MSSVSTDQSTASKSALQDNIESKGKNAYYFAHAHKANGPKWDGKPEPRLLVKHSSSSIEAGDDRNDNNDDGGGGIGISSISDHAESLIKSLKDNKSSFDFTKSNITKYAFLDENKKVKIYVDMKGVGEKCSNENDVKLDWSERSFSLKVYNYTATADDEDAEEAKASSEVQCLSFGKLHGCITKASVKVKTDRLVIILTKKVEDEEWPSIAQKGEDEHQVV